MQTSQLHAFVVFTCLVLLSACKTTDVASEGCELPPGVSVVSLELNEDQAGELPASGEVGFTVTATLNRSLTGDEFAMVCYIVGDSEVIRGDPIAAGFVYISSSDGDSATRDNNFNLTCEDGKVAGRAISSINDMDQYDRSTGERNTRIYVQHPEGLQSFAGLLTVGVNGPKSNRIRVECPR